jgi:hypothetical protein
MQRERDRERERERRENNLLAAKYEYLKSLLHF